MCSVIKPLVLSTLALWGALCCVAPSAALATASSDAAATRFLPSSSQTAIWMTTPAPMDGTEVEFPSNSVVYQRVKHRLPPKSFFDAHWYTGIIIIVLVVLAAYIVLALWVCHHFEYAEQRKAKKVVKHAYVTNGFFDLDRARRQRIVERQRAPPLTVSATSPLTESLTILSYVIVFSLYFAGFAVMVLAVVHRRRAVRPANSEEACAMTSMMSNASPARAEETSKATPTAARGSLQMSDLTVYRLRKLQNCVESDQDDGEQNAQGVRGETATAEAVSVLGRTPLRLCAHRCGETSSGGSSSADTKRRLSDSVDSTALAALKMSAVAKLLPLGDQELTAAADEKSDMSLTRKMKADPVRAMRSLSLSPAASWRPCAASDACATVQAPRRHRGGHRRRERCSDGRGSCGDVTAITAAAHVADTATWFAPSSGSSTSLSSESSSASTTGNGAAANTATAAVAAKTRPSTSPVLVTYVPLRQVRSSPTPVLPGYPSILDTGLEYETDAEVDAADVFVAVKAAPMPLDPRSPMTMNAADTAAAAPVNSHGSSVLLALADAERGVSRASQQTPADDASGMHYHDMRHRNSSDDTYNHPQRQKSRLGDSTTEAAKAVALNAARPSWRVCYRGYDALSPVQAVLACIEGAIIECSGSADAGAVQEVRCSSCAFDVLRCGSLAESNSTRAERDYHIRSGNEREEDGGSQPPSTQIRAFSAVLCSMGSGTATTHTASVQ
ncbi:putative integral membrane protein [Leishmania donovani]|uniref:Putative integral membrane protein n=1 Tax=Leishmania donovani TaxID=5661 RepID=A0A504XP19_LEIDO|nr:putative integral membrane protein [Leishmania donovani]